MEKKCNQCKEIKPIDCFGKRKASKDGIERYCKECVKVKNCIQYAIHRDKRLAAVKQNQKATSASIKIRKARRYLENRKNNLEQASLRYYNNIEERRRYAITRYHNNPELMSERAKRYAKAHPEKLQVLRCRRRARNRNAAGFCSSLQLKWRLEYHGYKCVYCGKDVRKNCHVDHMIPLSKGGSNWPSNLVPSCPTCNNSKHAKTYKEYKSLIEKRKLA